jgi:hypothetical protein
MQNMGYQSGHCYTDLLPLCTLEWSKSWTYRSDSSVQQRKSDSFVQQKINRALIK